MLLDWFYFNDWYNVIISVCHLLSFNFERYAFFSFTYLFKDSLLHCQVHHLNLSIKRFTVGKSTRVYEAVENKSCSCDGIYTLPYLVIEYPNKWFVQDDTNMLLVQIETQFYNTTIQRFFYSTTRPLQRW